MSHNIVQVGQTEVLLLSNVEEIAEGEVEKLHQIRNRFHDIPTVKMEGTYCNKTKLADEDRRTKPQECICFSCCR